MPARGYVSAPLPAADVQASEIRIAARRAQRSSSPARSCSPPPRCPATTRRGPPGSWRSASPPSRAPCSCSGSSSRARSTSRCSRSSTCSRSAWWRSSSSAPASRAAPTPRSTSSPSSTPRRSSPGRWLVLVMVAAIAAFLAPLLYDDTIDDRFDDIADRGDPVGDRRRGAHPPDRLRAARPAHALAGARDRGAAPRRAGRRSPAWATTGCSPARSRPRAPAPAATATRSRSSCSTSTASRPSTTSSGTPSATTPCASWPTACARALRAEDVLCRQGGDEFAVIAVRAGPVEGRELAVRLVDAVAEASAERELPRPVTASAGWATFGQPRADHRRAHRLRRRGAAARQAQRRRPAGRRPGRARGRRRAGLRRGRPRGRPRGADHPVEPRPRAHGRGDAARDRVGRRSPTWPGPSTPPRRACCAGTARATRSR